MEAEQAVRNIRGVKSIVNDVVVELYFSEKKSDKEIADSVIKALRENWVVPDHKIKVTVVDGWVTLEGVLHWNFQRKAADNGDTLSSGYTWCN